MKRTHTVITFSIVTALFFAGCTFFSTPKTVQTTTTPTPTSTAQTLTAQDIRTLIDTGVPARESGDYLTGEQKLSQAFDGAIALKDKALTIEAANNLSIQYRLSAGRAYRQKNLDLAHKYSDKSLAVYQQLKDLGWFDSQDPNIARNWAHALLYAGKIDDAIPALEASLKLQTAPAAQGDELDHLAVASLEKNDLVTAEKLNAQGLRLIQTHNGSKVWETFGLMTKATLAARAHQSAQVTALLNQALAIAQKEKLGVRQEEITYMLSLPTDQVDVLQTVGTPK